MRFVAILLCCGLMLAGCGGPAITLERLEPAKAHEVTQLRRISVVPLRNDQDRVATAAVENALSAVRLDQKPYFTLVDTHIQQSALGGKGVELFFEPGKIGQYGRKAGADGVLLGTVTQDTWRDERTYEQRSVCIQENDSGSCKKYAVRKTRCTHRTGTFAFIPKVVNTTSGQIIYSQEFTDAAEETACAGTSSYRLPSGNSLIAKARDRAIQRFIREIAPHAVRTQVTLLTEDDTAMPENIKKIIAQGITFAETERMDRACELWSQAAAQYPEGYALPYLKGVCAEFSGDLEQALAAYTEADQRTQAPEPNISAALQRVRLDRANQAELAAQTK